MPHRYILQEIVKHFLKERHHIQDLKPQHDCTFGVGVFCLWRGFGVFFFGWGGGAVKLFCVMVYALALE